MADIIQLLPDSIANQIAAGEVVQRPASVVKELLENAIDAGSSEIKLIIKDAGKGLIQVIDNGCGMSETDARMAFERHATSKIKKTEDLFAIRTMGFRGEALASIAAVAQVEIRTRRKADELGTRIVIEGSEVKHQEVCQCAAGTNFQIKNLFYNIPARRNFLKSNAVEMRHIMDEFQRIAIAHADIFFSLHHNNTEVFHLPASNLRQRIVGILGNHCNKKLVPVSEDTDVIKLRGFVGKPTFSKKTRGEQFFFVNNRFIKSSYLNHAVMGAYEDLLPKGNFPLYVIFLDIDPARIDINVHPTKQEIKFDDEKLIYNYMKVAIRHALGQYNITPTLDFNQETSFNPYATGATPQKSQSVPAAKENMITRSSKANGNGSSKPERSEREENNARNWEKLYAGLQAIDTPMDTTANKEEAAESMTTISSSWSKKGELDDDAESFSKQRKQPYQIHASYIVSQIKSGFLLIDQQAAHERILYERYLEKLNSEQTNTQKTLFPQTLYFSPSDMSMLKEVLPQINQLGFDIQDFGADSLVVHGIPADFEESTNVQKVVEDLLEQYKLDVDLALDTKERIAQSMARTAAIKRGQLLSPTEMKELIDQLFACAVPYKNPKGRNCFITYELDELEKRFMG